MIPARRKCALTLPGSPIPATRSVFVELLLDQLFELFHHLVGVRSFATNGELRSLARGEHHQAHDALAVDLFAFLLHPDFRTITTRDPDKHRRGTRVQTEPVDDHDLFLDLLPGTRRSPV